MGMRGQLGWTIRDMKPTNLQEAYDWAIHESTYFYKERRKDTHNITIDYSIMKEIVGQMK